MILRKPYAFLIKFFKLIHILMFIIFIYLLFSFRKIYIFFSNYVKMGGFTYFKNMASEYVPFILILAVIIILVASIFIYLLMKRKEKPVLFYKILIIYSVIVLVGLLFFRHFFNSLELSNYSSLTIVIYRDITFALYIISYFYVGFTFIRGFGFDIKKFSFEKDKKELKLDESDSAEYEVNINLDKDNINRHLKKQRREFKYYLKDNAKLFTIILIIFIVSLGSFLYYYFLIENKVYRENEEIKVNSLSFVLLNSYQTKEDKYSVVINEDNNFIVLDMEISNKGKDIVLDKEMFRINMNDKYYYPSTNYCESFNDLGKCYQDNLLIKANSKDNYYLVFQINDVSPMYLEVLKSKKSGYKYNKILINPKEFNKEEKNYKLGETMEFDNNNIQINNFKIVEKDKYTYQECIVTCTNFIKTISPSAGDGILVLNINNLDKIDKEFLSNSLGIMYSLNGNNYEVSSKNIKILDIHDNNVYLSVIKSALNKDNLILTVKTRYQVGYLKLR